MTDQEAFDKVVRHLLRQMKRSKNSYGCRFRGPMGLKCAIGALIPDEEYTPDMDARACGVRSLVRCFDPPSLRGLNRILLGDLQIVHDVDQPGDWARSLAELAERHGLTMPDLEAPNV